MLKLKKNLIAGDWVDGSSEIENRNPSDLSDLVGIFAQATADQLEITLQQARHAQVEWAAYGIERKYNVINGYWHGDDEPCRGIGYVVSSRRGKTFG